jgi:tRNA threonylcarbamoyladenosine biosynthesis protein TsaB
MLILTLKTDQALAELALFNDSAVVGELHWEAHRSLADTIHLKIEELLASHNFLLNDVNGLVCFKGPGSFTGLRIGLSVANALAYCSQCPVLAITGENWQSEGINKLLAGQSGKIALPFYGGDANISKPKK